jgi:transcription elongation factor Elf1
MRIKKINWQRRRDFEAVFVCPFCGAEETRGGYDDANFHQNVIPKLKCKKCGKSEADGDENYRPLSTKYPEGMQI